MRQGSLERTPVMQQHGHSLDQAAAQEGASDVVQQPHRPARVALLGPGLGRQSSGQACGQGGVRRVARVRPRCGHLVRRTTGASWP